MILRPYQQEAVNAVWAHLRARKDNPCVVLPTGTGKSLVLGQLATDAVTQWGGRVIILAHVKELLEQNADKIKALCPTLDLGVYSAGLKSRDTDNATIVAGIQSVYQRAEELGSFDLIVVDEAHLIPPDGEGMYRTFIEAATTLNPKVRIIGLTATPYRLKGGIICKPENILNHVCYEAGIKAMIGEGWLSPVRSRGSAIKADLSSLHIRGGDFIAGEIAEAMDRTELVSAAVSEIVKLTARRNRVLIFTSSVEHCHHVADEVTRCSGHECGIVTGQTGDIERAEILRRFSGERVQDGMFGEVKKPLKYLANVNVLTTGFDEPGIDCVVLLRPTASPGLYVQMVGRGTRLADGKTDCIVLDYGGNVLRHGPVDTVYDEDEPERRPGQAPAKECPTCMAALGIAVMTCPECGYQFPPAEAGESAISDTASDAGIMSGEVTDTDYRVDAVYYNVHTKRGADEDTPRTMKVTYRCGLADYHSEWVCPEHDGYARNKFVAWWSARSDERTPDTAERAVELADAGALAEPSKITVRSVAGEKYDRVIAWVLGDKPPRMDGTDDYLDPDDDPMPLVEQWLASGDDIPF